MKSQGTVETRNGRSSSLCSFSLPLQPLPPHPLRPVYAFSFFLSSSVVMRFVVCFTVVRGVGGRHRHSKMENNATGCTWRGPSRLPPFGNRDSNSRSCPQCCTPTMIDARMRLQAAFCSVTYTGESCVTDQGIHYLVNCGVQRGEAFSSREKAPCNKMHR